MSKENTSRQLLKNQLKIADKAKYWLEHSLDQARLINTPNLSLQEHDVLEALSSRYGRFVDILINKLFRSIDQYELLEPGTLIDTLNRSEKRGILSVETGRELKELRNKIVHEYDAEIVMLLGKDIIDNSIIAIQAYDRALKYLHDKQLLDS